MRKRVKAIELPVCHGGEREPRARVTGLGRFR